MSITWTSTGMDSTDWVDIYILDSRYSPMYESGDIMIVSDILNTGHYDWVIPSSLGELSGGTINGNSVYDIGIIAFNSTGESASDTSNARFSIYDGKAHFTSSTNLLCSGGGSISFANTTNSVDSTHMSYLWNFQNGIPNSSAVKNPPAINFASIGLDTVTLSVFDSVTSITTVETKTVRVDSFGVVIYGQTLSYYTEANPMHLCGTNAPLLGVHTPGVFEPSWRWEGYGVDTSMSTVHPIVSGLYKISVTDGYGCTVYDSTNLILDCLTDTTIAKFWAPDSLCSSTPLHMINLSVSSKDTNSLNFWWSAYNLTTGDWLILSYFPSAIPPVDFLAPGLYRIDLDITDSFGYTLSYTNDTVYIKSSPYLFTHGDEWWQSINCIGDSATITMYSTVRHSNVYTANIF